MCVGGRDSQQAPRPPTRLFLSTAEPSVALTVHFIFFFSSPPTALLLFLSFSLFVLSSVSRNESSLETCFGMHVRGAQAGFSGGQGPTRRESRKKRVGVVVKV